MSLTRPDAERQSPRAVLVTDDEPDLLDLMVFKLSRAGHEVRTATNAADALCIIQSGDVALAVLDVGLPGPSGLAAVAALRAKGHTIPIILVSAFAGSDDVAAGLAAGADLYLAKPFTQAELIARVEELLAGI